MAGDVEERLQGSGSARRTRAGSPTTSLDADARGKRGHGVARVDWLETLPDLRPDARPERIVAEPGFERWEGSGRSGTSPSRRSWRRSSPHRPHRRGSSSQRTASRPAFSGTGCGGSRRAGWPPGWPRPRRRVCPPRRRPAARRHEPARDRGPFLGRPSVRRRRLDGQGHLRRRADGRASPDDLVPFGGEQAHKAFALALGLQALVDALAGRSTARSSSSQRPAPIRCPRAPCQGRRPAATGRPLSHVSTSAFAARRGRPGRFARCLAAPRGSPSPTTRRRPPRGSRCS